MCRLTSILCLVLLLTMCITLSSPAGAAQLRFVLENEPIYTSSSKTSPGFLMEVVMEMTKILKIKPMIEWHAWGKAQELAIATPNTMIFPLARTKTREPNYLWICKVFDVKTVFISPKGAPLIQSIEQAKELNKIGVIEATPYHARLKELGFGNIKAMPSNQLQAALHDQKVDAVCTPGSEFAFAWKKAGYKTALQMGAELQTVPLWLAGSKKSDLIKVDEWIQAFDIVQQEGIFDQLYERYFGSGK